MENGQHPNGAPNDNELFDRAALFKALGDPTRLSILEAIAAEPDVCACGLLDRLHISQPTLSHHAKILCSTGIITCEKRGKWSHYRLSPARIDEILRYPTSLGE